MGMPSPLPVRDGVGATRLRVPMSGPWPTVAAYMTERFFHLDPDQLLQRFDRGEVVAHDGRPLAGDTPLGVEEFVWYYRDPPVDRHIPFEIEILHQDEHLLVVDKPHFLPTIPGGKFLQNSALIRLRRLLDNDELAPIHRLDRATAGLLMFSTRPATRGAYQLLFENRQVQKVYEAVSALPEGWDAAAPAVGGRPFPIVYRNHIRKDRAELRVQVDDVREPNAETLIEFLRADDRVVHTLLRPHSGKMHQLRVHLAALGIGILNDPFYPELRGELPDDFDHPMQLLARELRFTDPISGAERVFTTTRSLQEAP
ncbi:Ribosomal large subunit pseudouridine synthase A [Microbacterium oxydans]|uniref:RNA pseudouridylate synthase n=1 Tax=Microbacterium oxydans TaxID=82380 RepID=A0A0F0L883_9MICO|nr:pseudouridine synthase [Microbacterium oxydans]KJL28894.1 Ribosomal large subunit pseudouridine synthase A [Microbacterium oxydans]CAH0184202.1 Ribosomal large subunit pseudouridine synthase A [Microbacterium oxydans]